MTSFNDFIKGKRAMTSKKSKTATVVEENFALAPAEECEVFTTCSHEEDKDKKDEPVTVSFPTDEMGNIIPTRYLDENGKEIKRPEDAPYVFLGIPTTIRRLPEGSVHKREFREKYGSRWYIDSSEILWAVDAPGKDDDFNPGIIVSNGTTLITKHNKYCRSLDNFFFSDKEEVTSLIIIGGTIEVDRLVITGKNLLKDTDVTCKNFYFKESKATKSRMRSNGDIMLGKTNINDGRLIARSIDIDDTNFCESEIDISRDDGGIRIADSHLTKVSLNFYGRNTCVSVVITNRHIRGFSFSSGYNTTCPKQVIIKERIHYGHFSGIESIPFIYCGNGILTSKGIFTNKELTNFFNKKEEGFTVFSMDGGAVSQHDENNEELYKRLYHLIFGGQVMGETEIARSMINAVAEQMRSRTELIISLAELKGEPPRIYEDDSLSF